MGGLTPELTQVSLNKTSYHEAQPKQMGNLHERMKNVVKITKKCKTIPQSLIEAINLLENEVECYDPVPSYGQRNWVKPRRREEN